MSAYKRTSSESPEAGIPSKRSSPWCDSMGAASPSAKSVSNNRMKVHVRVRPLNEREQNGRRVIDVVDDQMLVFDPQEDDGEYIYHGRKYKEIGKRPPKNIQFV